MRSMNRRFALRLLGGLAFGFAGCLGSQLEKNSVVTSRDQAKAPKVSPASLQVAGRVDELAHRVIDQNTFTGIEPVVTVIGVPDAVLFHRGPSQLFISEGLVKKCKTDAELAAVLCSELGQMMSQKRAGVRVGRDRDANPAPAPPEDANGVVEAERALQQRRAKERLAKDQSDANQLARQLLKGAGFDPAELDRVDKMVKQSDRGEAIKKQMNGPAPAPTWNQ
jgi:predicted Zn-dependent protease